MMIFDALYRSKTQDLKDDNGFVSPHTNFELTRSEGFINGDADIFDVLEQHRASGRILSKRHTH